MCLGLSEGDQTHANNNGFELMDRRTHVFDNGIPSKTIKLKPMHGSEETLKREAKRENEDEQTNTI